MCARRGGIRGMGGENEDNSLMAQTARGECIPRLPMSYTAAARVYVRAPPLRRRHSRGGSAWAYLLSSTSTLASTLKERDWLGRSQLLPFLARWLALRGVGAKAKILWLVCCCVYGWRILYSRCAAHSQNRILLSCFYFFFFCLCANIMHFLRVCATLLQSALVVVHSLSLNAQH